MKALIRILGYLKPYKTQVVFTLFFSIFTTLLDLVPPWLVKVIIDRLVEESSRTPVYGLVIALALAFLSRNYSNYKRIMLNNDLEQKVVFDIRSHVFKSLHKLSINYFEARSTGEIMSRVNDDVTYVERIFIDGVEQVITALLTLVGITIILFYMHWKLAMVALIPIPLLVYGALKYTHRAHDLYYRQRERAARLNSVLQDIVSGIRETLSFNRQAHEGKRFDARSRDYCNGTLDVMRLWAVYSPAMVFLGSLGTVFILLFGIGLVRDNVITVGSLVAFLGYLSLFYGPINQLHSINHMLQHALTSAERLFEIIDAKPHVMESPTPFLPSTNVRGRINYDGVCFSYTKGIQVLHDISFLIEPGETIAMAGHSGSGKSTIVRLLLRFYETDAGAIKLDDHPIRDLPLAYLREQIGLVSQDPFLFNGTVAENILYGKLEANMDQAKNAARAAYAEEFILNLPKGYDTLVGERGIKLSGGERHRIAIARAFLKDPPILVLDEATANIDTETEAKIKSALHKLMACRTTLIVAHRLSTLEGAKRILVIQNGRLVENGTHDHLMEKKAVYANLFRNQVHL